MVKVWNESVCQHIPSLNMWALGSDWPPKSGQLSSLDLTRSQDLYLLRSRSEHSFLPTCYFWEPGGIAKAVRWSPPARPRERHRALSRHVPCPVTSREGCSHLNLLFLQQLLWEYLFFFLAGWGWGWGEGLKMSSWRSDSWGHVHWGNWGCSYNLSGGLYFHQSFITSLSRAGHKLHSEWWAESYNSPVVKLFWKVLHLSQN